MPRALRWTMSWFCLGVAVTPAASVRDLIGRADGVVLARAVEWSAESATSVRVVLKVEQGILKGDILPGATIIAVVEVGGTPSA